MPIRLIMPKVVVMAVPRLGRLLFDQADAFNQWAPSSVVKVPVEY